ncbi:DUF7112 family protein [Halegenticoccus tardaugens]|uniref:DUF7112 family protein n=1 Tax=Halegenticoccus tardaugens TaxID=2071624 RepID=UPI00100A53E7|nr:hypothetical protein [Halegenticoccus tardaugens]
MPDRVPSDHASVTTVRGTLARSGGTRRPCLRIPPDADGDLSLDAGEIVRLSLDGAQYHARVTEDANGLVIRGAYDNRRLAREPDGAQNRLVEWAESTGRSLGSSVKVDEVEPGFLYGVRVPGVRTVYAVTEKPDESLASIARSLDEENGGS